jgi:Cdc6-like AAA superfamily ATPase
MNASHTKYVDDLPADPPEFEFDLIAEALAGILAEPARRSVVLGLHGQWGSGKTTLMDALRTQLVSAVTDPITVDFNAWKYQERSALWRALILRVLGELKKCSTPEEGPAIEELEQSLYRTFAVRENGPWSVNWRTLIVEAASIGLSAIHLGVAGEIIRALGLGRRNRHPKESDYSKVVSGTDFEKLGGVLERRIIDRQVVQVESVEQFLGKFTELVDRLTASGRKVFVLIDDLDRCLPGAALEIFEAIKLFMDAPNCRFVVAVIGR